MIKILIAADIVPRIGDEEAFKKVSPKIFEEISPFVRDADMSIVNLEAPVVAEGFSPIIKSGPVLHTSAETVEALKNVGFTSVTLANNHFFDQGQTGVENTISACHRFDMEYLGGGKDVDEARRILLKDIRGKRVAFINACENEFSIANNEHGGSNPLDLIHMQEDITAAKRDADYVLAIIHGGVEQYQYPTPRMKRWYRHFVDLGVDAVVNHHQHCMCGYEVYAGKPIFYGLGNFYFPRRHNAPHYKSWGYGYAVILSLGETIGYEMIPYAQDIDGIRTRNRSEFEIEMDNLCLPIADDAALQKQFDEYILDCKRSIELAMMPNILRCRIVSALIRRGVFGEIYKGKQVSALKNRLACESHYEKTRRLFELLSK